MRAEHAVKLISRDYEKAIHQMNLMKNAMDLNTRVYRAKKAGLAEGKLEIARKLKEMGDPVEKIHAVTGLSLKTIEQM